MPKKILIVDDSRSIRQQLNFTLSKAGYDVLEADDGLAGFEVYESNSEISLVICDINMPRLDGLAMLEKIAAESSRTNIPIVMLTTEGSKEMITRAKATGAKGWLVKPFNPEQLVAAVGKLAC